MAWAKAQGLEGRRVQKASHSGPSEQLPDLHVKWLQGGSVVYSDVVCSSDFFLLDAAE